MQAKRFQSHVFYNLGNTAYRQGALEEAVEKYTAALALTPDDREAAQNLEFVQKQLENRPRGDSPPGERNPPTEPGADGAPGEQGDSGPPPPANQPAGGRDPEGEQAENERPSIPAEQAPGPGAGSGETIQEQNAAAGAQLLNRLKDEPGRALMPHYQKRRVDKDW